MRPSTIVTTLVATCFLVLGCGSAPEDALPDEPLRAPLKGQPLEVFDMPEGIATSYCPPDLDGGPFLCAMYCPKDNPNCGQVGDACDYDAWDVDGDGQVYAQECHSATQSKAECELCCDVCGTDTSNQTCPLNCPIT